MPGLLVHFHLHQHVAGVELALALALLAVAHFHDLFGRHENLAEAPLEAGTLEGEFIGKVLFRTHHDEPAEAILDAAVQAAAALVVGQYQREYPAARPREGRGRGLAGRIEAAAASSPRLKRTVREFSSRYPAVRRLRVLAWRALERIRTRGQ